MCVVNLERLRGLWWCVPVNGFTAQPAWFVACSSACFELSAQFAPPMTLQLHLLLVTFSTNREGSHLVGGELAVGRSACHQAYLPEVAIASHCQLHVSFSLSNSDPLPTSRAPLAGRDEPR
jgi:hypothetical protein